MAESSTQVGQPWNFGCKTCQLVPRANTCLSLKQPKVTDKMGQTLFRASTAQARLGGLIIGNEVVMANKTHMCVQRGSMRPCSQGGVKRI